MAPPRQLAWQYTNRDKKILVECGFCSQRLHCGHRNCSVQPFREKSRPDLCFVCARAQSFQLAGRIRYTYVLELKRLQLRHTQTPVDVYELYLCYLVRWLPLPGRPCQQATR